MKTEWLTPDQAGIARAADMLREGALVAFATETVYGLGADATNPDAVAGIFAAKGRPSFNPLIVHVARAAEAQCYVLWTDEAEKLATAFWPGPLTLVLPSRPGSDIAPLAQAGLPSVALRVPGSATAQALLVAVGRPVAAPSANLSGQISPTTAAHVAQGLDGKIAAILDDGPCTVGVESTIVGLTGPAPQLLRPGGVSQEAIGQVLGHPLNPASDEITAPGQLRSHYAPQATMRLNARAAQDGEFMIGFGKVAGDVTLSASGDLRQAAARLFETLHLANATKRPIAVAPIPHDGLGAAINDRLTRAAAPRGA